MAAQAMMETVSAARDKCCAMAAPSLRLRDLPGLPLESPSLLSPRDAMAWADSILHYWEHALAAGSLHLSEPLYLFDLAAAKGQSMWLMLQALRHRLSASHHPFRPCYVICGNSISTLDALATHPYLNEDIVAGRFDTAYWQPGQQGVTLRAQKLAVLQTDNPIVLLSAGGFAPLPVDLYGIEQGHLMEGMVMPIESSCETNTSMLEFDWRKLDGAALAQLPYGSVLKHCLERFTWGSLFLPYAACQAVDDFFRLSGGRYFLLATDPGCHLEQQVRLGKMAPPSSWPPPSPLPCNFHALSVHQQQQGAWTWNHQLRDDGLVLHAALRCDDAAATEHAWAEITAPLYSNHPDDSAILIRHVTRITDVPVLLGVLRQSHYDPRILLEGLALLQAQASTFDITACRSWQTALTQTWDHYFPPQQENDFPFRLAWLAAILNHWKLARRAWHADLCWYGEHVQGLRYLALCEAATGNHSQAVKLVTHALTLEPGHPDCLALHSELQARTIRRQNTHWFHEEIAIDGALQLEPIASEHAEVIYYQWRDPQIAEMTRLPDFVDVEQVRQWIARQAADTSRQNYAVMHCDAGFVGMVSVCVDADAGYFYFWTGTDFQDKGWGKRAAHLLFRQASHNGIRHLFTSVYADNARSGKTLAQLGFHPIGIQAHAPDDKLLFLHTSLPDTKVEDESHLKLRFFALCEAIRCGFVFD